MQSKLILPIIQPDIIAMSEVKKNVLITHTNEKEGRLWQAVLESQKVGVSFEENWHLANLHVIELIIYKVKNRLPIPDALLMDISVINLEELNLRKVCLWCSKYLPELKVFLLNSQKDSVSDLERRWAFRRGAVDLLPKLTNDNLLISVVRVTSSIGCPLVAQPLKYIAELIPKVDAIAQPLARNGNSVSNVLEQRSLTESQPTILEQDRADGGFSDLTREIVSNSTQETIRELTGSANQEQKDDSNYIIYRGVKIYKNSPQN